MRINREDANDFYPSYVVRFLLSFSVLWISGSYSDCIVYSKQLFDLGEVQSVIGEGFSHRRPDILLSQHFVRRDFTPLELLHSQLWSGSQLLRQANATAFHLHLTID